MKTKQIAATVVLLFSFSLFAQEPPGGADAKVIAKLMEIVKVREQLVEIVQALYASGRASAENGAGVEAAQVELAEARVDLAREQGRRDGLIAALQELVTANERRLESAKRMKELARASDIGVKQAQVALLGAQVLLLREQK
jgi:hypothetical protein